jgi:hypothetical protein
VFFVSVILRSALLRAMNATKLSKKYSIESMLIDDMKKAF